MNPLTLPYSDRGPEVGGEENGGGQTSSPGEVLHTVGKHKQETCSLSGLSMETSKQINLECQIFGVKEIGPFAFLGLFGIEKITTVLVILTKGRGQTPTLGPGYPIFF